MSLSGQYEFIIRVCRSLLVYSNDAPISTDITIEKSKFLENRNSSRSDLLGDFSDV